jgi:hypothetical protein
VLLLGPKGPWKLDLVYQQCNDAKATTAESEAHMAWFVPAREGLRLYGGDDAPASRRDAKSRAARFSGPCVYFGDCLHLSV